MSVCLIGLGSNQGERQATLDAATDAVSAIPGCRLIARSTWRETAAVGGPLGQPRFLNGAAKLDTSLSPQELLGRLQQIEQQLGRRRAERWGPRSIDLDLLLYDSLVVETPDLVLPHPRMALRRFVLEPAAEVAGEMLHPTIRWTVSRLLEHLNGTPRYVAITGGIGVGKSHLAERLVESLGARLIAERPDWAELDAFYAEPAANAWDTELRFLRQRAELLAKPAFDEPTSRWHVSDFWFEQSAAFARVWLASAQLPAFLEQQNRLAASVLRPRLVVRLDAPAEVLLERVGQRGRTCERRLTVEQLDRIRRSVIEQTMAPNVGPVLCLSSKDAEAALVEALAAVRGME
ncbi:MAG: 2-amino-4-hydroxy-6-hydroxymethyldihydropteridine diphosphokinase [Planctomycetaceae bacterium]|nr:2-amino-4-hydroxy-6-hydroxymethyldihydropteridine diphosphokinase [Planctomycetaceae bacterium]